VGKFQTIPFMKSESFDLDQYVVTQGSTAFFTCGRGGEEDPDQSGGKGDGPPKRSVWKVMTAPSPIGVGAS